MRVAPTMLVLSILGGCATQDIGPRPHPIPPTQTDTGTTSTGKGGYYLDDGPGDAPPVDLESIPDAVPRAEPLHRPATKPYTALGRSFTPMTQRGPYKARGTASWYGRRYHGKPTSTGERYDMYAMSAAHPTLPLPSYARVTSVTTGRSVVVRVNDRGPFRADRLIDLSYVAAHRLGLVANGSGPVDVEAILPDVSASPPALSRPSVVPPDTADAVPIDPPAAGTYLQFGAFSEQALAEDFVRRVRADAPDIGKPLAVFTGGSLFKVQAGPFTDRDTARRESDRLAARLGGRPFPVTR